VNASFSCDACHAGKLYWVSNESFGCRPCPVDHACPHATPQEIICEDGSEPNFLQDGCQNCPSGRAMLSIDGNGTSGTCQPCANGQHPSTDRVQCVLCENGTYSTGDSCRQCELGWEVNSQKAGCAPCTLGKYSPDGIKCIRCPPRREPSRETQAIACIQCEAGKYSADMATWQDLFGVAGFYTTPTMFCEDCPAGRFSLNAAAGCQVCPSGTTPTSSRDRCDVCPEGKAGIEGVCETCELGSAPNEFRGASGCQVCSTLGLGITATLDGTRCERCPFGKQPHANGSSCERCPENMVSVSYKYVLHCSAFN